MRVRGSCCIFSKNNFDRSRPVREPYTVVLALRLQIANRMGDIFRDGRYLAGIEEYRFFLASEVHPEFNRSGNLYRRNQ